MVESVVNTPEINELMRRVAGCDQQDGDPRLKQIVERVATEMCRIIEEFDVTPSEFWTACGYLTRLGQANEVGLLVPGLGVEHFLDLLTDEKERRAGLEAGTPRTIEGPLYITDAPLSQGEARLDQDPEDGLVLFMQGQVRDTAGKPVPGAIVDVWHANTRGGYSHFDPSQSPYNLRRRIETDGTGATASARSCRRAMVVRRAARPRSCLRRWGGTASAPRTSTSSSKPPAIAS